MLRISDAIRARFKQSDDIRDAGLTAPSDIHRYDDIAYGPDECQRLDVYRPAGAGVAPLPVIVSVHGGAWVYGDKERYQYYCMSLAQRGFAVVNFSYRLAPEHKFPASLEDTNAVFKWVLAHADEYAFDTDNIFAVGDSSGAHILALYACLCTDPSYADMFTIAPPRAFVPSAIALNCGIYSIEIKGELNQLTALLMRELLERGGTPGELARLSAAAHVTPAFPPTFLMTSEGDSMKAKAPELEQKLKEHGVPYVYRLYGDADNPLPHVFHCDLRLPDAAVCNGDECEFFKQYLRQE